MHSIYYTFVVSWHCTIVLPDLLKELRHCFRWLLTPWGILMVISITLELISLEFLGKSVVYASLSLTPLMNTWLSCRFIDSSEMVSTFGSSPSEVRGFITGGWTACKNREGKNSSVHTLDDWKLLRSLLQVTSLILVNYTPYLCQILRGTYSQSYESKTAWSGLIAKVIVLPAKVMKHNSYIQ